MKTPTLAQQDKAITSILESMDKEPIEGIWTDRSHGLAFCWPCLDKMGGLAEGVADIAEGIRSGDWVECESCGIPVCSDGYDERMGR
jgi:hypothetical protein